VSFSELENDTLNQAELNEIKRSPLLTNYTHELMTAKQNTDNRQ
jgi:hypothetical protein